MSYGIIYKITNIINSKTYVGQTIQDITKRWKDHVYASKKPRYPLHYAIQRHGKENFIIETLCECLTQEEMDEKEIFWGVEFKSLAPDGYSLRFGQGKGIVSEETRNKQSLLRMGDKNPNFGKRFPKEQHSKFGKKDSEETKLKKSLASKGKSKSEEHKNNQSKAMQGKYSGENSPFFGKHHSEETKKKSAELRAKTYHFLSPLGVTVTIINLREFCRENPNLDRAALLRVHSGKCPHHKGWTKSPQEILSP